MPAYMSIGAVDENDYVDPPVIKGDVTGMYHTGWIYITGFDVGMKESDRKANWESAQGGQGARSKARRTSGTSKDKASKKDAKSEKEKAEEEKKKKLEGQKLSVKKPRDSSSTQIIEWAKGNETHDIQIDCCSTEEAWPYLTLLFLGVTPTDASLQEADSDSLDFLWKRAIVYTWAFDEAGNWQSINYAEFGEEEASGTTTAAERGLADYTPPQADSNASAGQGKSGVALGMALAGGLPPVPEESEHYDQERRTLKIEKVGELEFELESFRIDERLSSLFTYDLELRSAQTAIEASKIVGHEIAFSIQEQDESSYEREPRYFTGIVGAWLAGVMTSDQRRRYHATVYPSAWRLTLRSTSRVFQDVTVKDVVEKVFADAGFSDYDLSGVTKAHPKMAYCVQYQESDFAFVSRQLEVAGIFYYFKNEEKKHTMMLCDGPAGYVPCPLSDDLKYGTDVHNEPRITSWRTHYAFVPGKYVAHDYNFETPKDPVKAESQTKLDLPEILKAEVFEYPGGFPDSGEGTTVCDRRLQARETGHVFAYAVSCYDCLSPGMSFAVKDRPGESESAASERFVITGIKHFVEQLPEYGISIVSYRNVFTAIPETVTFTPPRVTPKPVMYGPQTAVVVGDKVKDEDVVDTDKYGRIKVQFHWDRLGKKDKDSSCWMRVAQSLAGGGFGSMAIPRIGWEVVVSFLNGDPDRPLVTGVVYNELHMPYHELPTAKYKTVLMTRTFKGGKENFNELTFHDEKDKEEIYLHAERDFKRVVEHDDVLEIGEKEKGGQTVKIKGDQKVTLEEGNRELSIAKGTDTSTIKGDRKVTIQSGNETLTVSSGDQKVDVSSGKSEVSAATSIELKVGGNSVKIDTSSITLTVGGSSIKVDNMGVQLKGTNVKGEATMAAELKGMMTKVSGDGMLETKGGLTKMQ